MSEAASIAVSGQVWKKEIGADWDFVYVLWSVSRIGQLRVFLTESSFVWPARNISCRVWKEVLICLVTGPSFSPLLKVSIILRNLSCWSLMRGQSKCYEQWLFWWLGNGVFVYVYVVDDEADSKGMLLQCLWQYEAQSHVARYSAMVVLIAYRCLLCCDVRIGAAPSSATSWV